MKVVFEFGHICDNGMPEENEMHKIKEKEIGINWKCYVCASVPRIGEFVVIPYDDTFKIVDNMKNSEDAESILCDLKQDYNIETLTDMEDVGRVEDVTYYPASNMSVVTLMPIHGKRENK